MIDGNSCDLLRILYRQPAKPHSIDQLKDRCIRADAQGQGQNRRHGEQGIRAELASGIA